MSPAGDPRNGATNRAPVLTQPSVGDQDDAGPAVRDLAAVVASHPPNDRWVGIVVVAEALRGRQPTAGLRLGIGLGVGDVLAGDAAQVLILESVASVVLLGDLGERERERVVLPLPFVSDPGSGGQVARSDCTRHVSLDLGTEHEGDVVAA